MKKKSKFRHIQIDKKNIIFMRLLGDPPEIGFFALKHLET